MWQVILGIGIAFLILEMFVPGMFFLNFSIAGFICALLSLFTKNIPVLIAVFCVLSLILLLVLRPYLISIQNKLKTDTGMNEKYIGKTANVVEKITKDSGTVSIYGERWQARSQDETEIEVGEKVEIVSHESIILTVKKA